ncbi:Amino acid transporter [Thalictrum thalictroides]|uniref:Amino acid transporter n=1 Tax=Thalictrum thalictroides TaxID=46969 RepID=A0A7J6VAY6_THATH|nr:Amino acid transporter [Thalictrum thalictroides]
MIISSIEHVNERRSMKKKQIVDEKAPLLPSKQDEFKGASFTGAVFNLSTTIVGAGIMALPATMKVLGLGPGILMIIFMAFLTETSIEMLLRFSKAGKSVSYGGLMGVAFGRTGDVLSGTSASGVHHAGLLEGWFGVHWWSGRFFVLVVTTLAIFAPLACFKRVDSLRFTSALSVALAVLFVVITAGITIVKIFNGSIAMPRWLPVVTDMTAFFKLFTVVPVLVTAYICHYNGMNT